MLVQLVLSQRVTTVDWGPKWIPLTPHLTPQSWSDIEWMYGMWPGFTELAAWLLDNN